MASTLCFFFFFSIKTGKNALISMLLLGVQHKFKHDAKHRNQPFEKCFEIKRQWGSWQNSPMLSFLFSFTEKENYVDGTFLVTWDSLLHYFQNYASAKNNCTDYIYVLYLYVFFISILFIASSINWKIKVGKLPSIAENSPVYNWRWR